MKYLLDKEAESYEVIPGNIDMIMYWDMNCLVHKDLRWELYSVFRDDLVRDLLNVVL